MRVLCLQFREPPKPFWADLFLRFTPKIILREPDSLFLEVSSTNHFWGGEKELLSQVFETAQKLTSLQVLGAIADQATTAQALATYQSGCVGRAGHDAVEIANLPVDALIELEGLSPWSSRKKMKAISGFFVGLGFKKLGELQKFSHADLFERWGEVGGYLWKRLHAVEPHPISPYVPREPLESYVYFDHPTEIVPLVMGKLRPALEVLFLRLEGQGRFAQSLNLILHCEWSQERHRIQIEPVVPSRDFDLYCDLLTQKLERMSLENPVKEIELSVTDVPEKIQQLDFFEPRERSEDRWKRLISFAAQGDIEMGFLQPVAALFPEETMKFQPAVPGQFHIKDDVEKNEEAIQIRTAYAKTVTESPRPSLLLDPPKELDRLEAESLKRLTPIPAERMTGPWWNRRPEEGRDYYYAVSPEGRLLWIYKDKATKQVFLQGAFD